jgi:hypothetical protein
MFTAKLLTLDIAWSATPQPSRPPAWRTSRQTDAIDLFPVVAMCPRCSMTVSIVGSLKTLARAMRTVSTSVSNDLDGWVTHAYSLAQYTGLMVRQDNYLSNGICGDLALIRHLHTFMTSQVATRRVFHATLPCCSAS